MNQRWAGGFGGGFPTAKPRPVEGGLKARSARGDIGSSWWSKRFLAVLESFALGTRLTRGRAYARKGQVISLDVEPGVVRAAVQGSRARPYQVTISFEPLHELIWAKAEIALSEQALPSARLLAGEVPPELEEIFADAGAALFPTSVKDLAQRCSCPDQQVPCKHLAATFYLLAEEFDADPFLILRWRGRDREALLGRLRELRSDAGPNDSRAPADRAVAVQVTAGAALALTGLSEPPDDAAGGASMVDRFYSTLPLPPRPAVLDSDADLLLRQLPPPGTTLGGDALVRRLRPVYDRFAAGGTVGPMPADDPAETHVSPDTDGKPKDLLVIESTRGFTCADCGTANDRGELLTMDDAGPLCLACADLSHLEFLPRGETALTRRARKYSALSAVVVRWSTRRRRYERQGIVAESDAIERAERECLADADARERRRVRAAVRRDKQDTEFVDELAAAIRAQFPACPPERALRIARHAGERSSGRIGRTAAGRALDPVAVRLAVVASVRHEDTDYDELLMGGVARFDARDIVRPAIDDVLERWQSGTIA